MADSKKLPGLPSPKAIAASWLVLLTLVSIATFILELDTRSTINNIVVQQRPPHIKAKPKLHRKAKVVKVKTRKGASIRSSTRAASNRPVSNTQTSPNGTNRTTRVPIAGPQGRQGPQGNPTPSAPSIPSPPPVKPTPPPIPKPVNNIVNQVLDTTNNTVNTAKGILGQK